MAIKITDFGGTDWSDGDVLYSVDLINTITEARNLGRWIPMAKMGTQDLNGVVSIVGYAEDTWSIVLNGSIKTTTDGGESYTEKNTDLDSNAMATSCKADRTHAFFVEPETGGNFETAYTGDSGATITTKTAATYTTEIRDVSFPTTSLIVIGGDDGGGANHIIWSDDNGTSWTDATTQPSSDIFSLDMYDGTYGVAVDSSGKIWKTVNSAVTWTDTGATVTVSGVGNSIYMTSTTGYIVTEETSTLMKLSIGDTSSGIISEEIITFANASGADCQSTFFKTTNGTIYLAVMARLQTDHYILKLFKTSDSGTTWQYLNFGDVPDMRRNWVETIMSEEKDNVLIINIGGAGISQGIIKISDN